MSNSICLVGWYYFTEVYKYFCKEHLSKTYVVGHRHNEILDKYKFKYSIIKNIGLEFGIYDWYIKNVWDGKSNVLFIQDDLKIYNKKVIDKIFKKCSPYDYVYILERNRAKDQGKSYRCFYLSKKTIKLLLKDFNGIWYDKYNQGYVTGYKHTYDPEIYTEKYYRSCDGVGRQFKKTLIHLREKYDLKWDRIPFDDIYFYRGGSTEGRIDKRLVDNSIFNKIEGNRMEDIYSTSNSKRNRENNYYTKWYNFYFEKIKNDNLNILEIGAKDRNKLNLWGEYFKNSTIYGISNEKEEKNIFCMKNFLEENLKKIEENVEDGFNIIIDNGEIYKENRIDLFEFLFKKMKNWGIYVFEDVYKNEKLMEFLKERISDLNYNSKYETMNIENNINKKDLSTYEKNIAAINFHSGICFIFKRFG